MNLYEFFPQLLNMSVTASVAILVILILRLVLKRQPKIISYALWSIVLFRLLCPVSITSDFSFLGIMDISKEESLGRISSIEYVPSDIIYTGISQPLWPDSGAGELSNKTLPQQQEQSKENSSPASITMVSMAAWIWLMGVWGMILYGIITYIRLKKSLVGVVLLRDNIFLSDYIASPFLMGLLQPKIYLPSTLTDKEQTYIILHEQHHIRRFDHGIKILSFLALCIHWFNPLVWLAFVLSANDMEMSCDEAVVRKMGAEIRAEYSSSLLSLATGRRLIAGTPLAFGEGNAKERIKNLANWKKPVAWAVVFLGFVCLAVGVGLLTNPKEKAFDVSGSEGDVVSAAVLETDTANLQFDDDSDSNEIPQAYYDLESAVSAAILEHNTPEVPDGLIRVESHEILSFSVKTNSEDIDAMKPALEIVYALVLYEAYSPYYPEQDPESVEGSYIPTALSFSVDENGAYTLKEYWIPRDGSYYAVDIRDKFPNDDADIALNNSDDYIDELSRQCKENALALIRKQGAFDDKLEELFETICNSSSVSSDPGDYIEEHREEYDQLIGYGKFTLRYCFEQFLQGDQTGLKGHIMAAVCEAIAVDWGEGALSDGVIFATGQEWFEEFKSNAEKLKKQYEGEEYMKNYPASWLLLQMMSE